MYPLKFGFATLLSFPLMMATGSLATAIPVETNPVETKQNVGSSTDSATLLQVQGILEPGDLTFSSDGTPYDEYSFGGRAGQSITINLQSPDFDTYVILLDPNGNRIAENDDISQNNLNSSLTTTLPVAGTYRVLTNSYDAAGRGRYTLTVTTVLGTGDLQATLRWETTDDLDLAIMAPDGQVVNFSNTPIASGGQLDVDANALCEGLTSTPVENVFWPPAEAPRGQYTVAVSLYQRCNDRQTPIPFTLILRVQGTTQTLNGMVDEQNQVITFPVTVN